MTDEPGPPVDKKRRRRAPDYVVALIFGLLLLGMVLAVLWYSLDESEHIHPAPAPKPTEVNPTRFAAAVS